MPSESTSAVPMNISRLAYGVKWICLPTNPNKNSGNNLPQKYVSFKRKIRIYRKRRPAITFILPRVNAFSANGTTAVFILTTEVSIGISRLPIIRLIHTDYPAYTLPTEISRAYLNHEISIRDVYVYWRKNCR